MLTGTPPGESNTCTGLDGRPPRKARVATELRTEAEIATRDLSNRHIDLDQVRLRQVGSRDEYCLSVG